MSRKRDLQTLFGGLCLLSFSYLDKDWSYFWIAAGVIMIGWSLVTMLQPRTGN